MRRKFKLGDKVRDKISGLEGIITSRIEFLNGCVQYGIQPPVTPDGTMREVEYIDEEQLEHIEEKKKSIKKNDTGGGIRCYPKKNLVVF